MITQHQILTARSGLGRVQQNVINAIHDKGPVCPNSKAMDSCVHSLARRGIVEIVSTEPVPLYGLTDLGKLVWGEINYTHLCSACFRAEEDCSRFPCAAVQADRAQVDPTASASTGAARYHAAQAALEKLDGFFTGELGEAISDLIKPIRVMEPMDIFPMVSCKDCGSGDVQILYPAWHDPNDNLSVVDSDLEAEPLDCYCTTCDEKSGDGSGKTLLSWEFGDLQEITGRWS